MIQFNVQREFQGGFHTPMVGSQIDIVVHHAAALYPQQRGIDDVQVVADYHKSKGWAGIGYHIALAELLQGGEIARYNLSPLDMQRAHVAMRNHQLIGVSCLTNFDKHPDRLPEGKWFDALVEVLKDLLKRYPKARILGHKEAALAAYPTACPGVRWADWKPRLLAAVNAPNVAVPAPVLPADRHPVGMEFLGYWQASGGIWMPDRFAPGLPTTPVQTGADGNKYQGFERVVFRYLPNSNRVESLFRSEAIPSFV